MSLGIGYVDQADLDYFEQVALGNVPERSWGYKFGRVITAANERRPIWDGNSTYIFPTSADTVTITSDDLNDAPAGTGARSIHVYGLDENWESVNEVVALNGTSTTTFIRIFRMHVEESGTADFPLTSSDIGNNIGTITATHNGTSQPVAKILPRNGQTLMAIFTVPVGYKLLMWAAKTGISKGQSAVGFLYSKDNAITNAPWRCRGIRDMYQNNVGNEFKAPNVYTEKTDLVLAVEGDVGGNPVTGTFQYELVRNI